MTSDLSGFISNHNGRWINHAANVSVYRRDDYNTFVAYRRDFADHTYVVRNAKGNIKLFRSAGAAARFVLALPPSHEALDMGYDEYPPPCTNPAGHSWVIEDTDGHGEGRAYCEWCLADGDA